MVFLLFRQVTTIITLLLICHTFSYANVPTTNEDIVIQLSTTSPQEPLFLHFTSDNSSTFSKTYLQQLEKIIRFDLENNGRTQLLPHSTERDALAKNEHFDSPFNTDQWKNLGARYVVRMHLQNKLMSCKTCSVTQGTVKVVNNIDLSGKLSEDRKKIHSLADAIHIIFFHTPGIASTRLIYALRDRKQTNKSTEWTSEIWECDYDGGNAHQITQTSGYCISPAYVPAKQGYSCGSFFYVSYLVGQPKIFTASLRNGVSNRFSYLRGNQLMPTISQKRDMIAFISDASGNADLFVQQFNPETGPLGKPYQIFSAHRGTQASPTFSPDGKRIAFVSNKDGSPRIYVINIPKPGSHLKSIKPQMISKENRENTSPAWSPDGTKITYSAKTNGVRQIWIYDLQTRQERQLTKGPSHKENPSWAPNSQHIVFDSSTPFSSELFLVHIDCLNVTQISSGPGEKRFPCWEAASS